EREDAAEVESTTIEENNAEINTETDSSVTEEASTAETEGQSETQIATTTSAGSILDKIDSGGVEI
ncbi:MAG TPA: hypothetical protein DEO62_06180, partial [Lachnospiraceae bacterium]|nr:hypothetical protein [Lachnospiraceae bacterium]